MNNSPHITVTSIDLERLEDLIDTLPVGSPLDSKSLLKKLGKAEVKHPLDISGDIVTMNSTVRFIVDSLPRELCMTVVYPEDALGDDHVSIFAPVGSALLGVAAGASVEWPKPGGGVLNVNILEVVGQPEREGDFAR